MKYHSSTHFLSAHMNRIRLLLIALVFLLPVSVHAQDETPFIFSFQGGLFFPSRAEHYRIYKSHSDLLWAVGGAVPISNGVFITSDIAFFRSRSIVGAQNDSIAKYEEHFIHFGFLNKQPLSRTVFIRLMVGLNRIGAKETLVSSQTPEYSNETEKKIGYFGGGGIEQIFDNPHFSIYADLIYDYSRSYNKDLSGDMGGVRFVVGVNIIMF